MALVGNISGSNGQSKNAVTGSLVIADVSANFPVIASDAVLFVSGNINGDSKAVIGGDLVASGSILVKDSMGVTNITLTPLGNMTGSNMFLSGDIAVNGGDLTSTAATFNLATNLTTQLNVGGTTPTIYIGTSTGNSFVEIGRGTNTIAASTKTINIGNNTAATATVNVNIGSANALGRTTLQQDVALTTGNLIGAPGAGANVMTLISSGNIVAKLDTDGSADGHRFAIQDFRNIDQFSVGENGNAELSGSLVVTGSFTGSNALFTGDIAVNGGDITTTGAVLNISAGANGLAFLNGTSPFVLAQSSSYNSMPGVVASANVGKIFAAAGKDLLIGPDNAKSVFITGSSVVVNADTNGFQVQKDGTELLRIVSGSGNNFLNINSGPNMLTANMFTSNIVNMSFGSATSTASFGGDLGVNGRTGLAGVTERMSHFQGGNTFICNMINQSIFYVSSPSGGVTANFTNVPTTTNRIHTPTVILSQSGTPQIVSTVQIDGGATTILWSNGVTPTGTANKIEAFGFSLIRSGSVWTVLGQMSTYG